MKKGINESTSLVSSLNLENEEMSIEKYLQLVGEEIVDVEYNMVELVDLAWGVAHLSVRYAQNIMCTRGTPE